MLKRPALMLAGLALSFSAAQADDISVSALKIDRFKGALVGEQVDGLIWRGGLVLTSDAPQFGGLSGITFTGPGHKLVMVTDTGQFVSGHLIHDEAGQPLGFGGVSMDPIRNSKGAELPRAFARDAEAVETIIRDGVPAAIRVGFENLTRVADFELENGQPKGAAREVNIPDWLTRERTNESLEAVCIAPPASPVAGSTLLFTEAAETADGWAAFMLGNRDRGELSLSRANGFNPTDCAFLPNGDLLVLERGTVLLSFTMQIRRVPAAEVQPGRALTGEVILSAQGSDIDNMEGIAVHDGPNGETRITIVSDDNFNDWERSLLLEFALVE